MTFHCSAVVGKSGHASGGGSGTVNHLISPQRSLACSSTCCLCTIKKQCKSHDSSTRTMTNYSLHLNKASLEHCCKTSAKWMSVHYLKFWLDWLPSSCACLVNSWKNIHCYNIMCHCSRITSRPTASWDMESSGLNVYRLDVYDYWSFARMIYAWVIGDVNLAVIIISHCALYPVWYSHYYCNRAVWVKLPLGRN